MLISYSEAKQIKERLTLLSIEASKALKAIDGVGSGVMGLTPDSVKDTREYKEARINYLVAHDKLRRFNRLFMKHFKKEYKQERKGRF